MGKIKKQVNIKFSRHYTIMADTEDDFKKFMESCCEYVAFVLMRESSTIKSEDYIRPVGNCAFVTAEVLNDAKSNFSFVVAEKTD